MSAQRMNFYVDRIKLAMDMDKLTEIFTEACEDPDVTCEEFIDMYLMRIAKLANMQEVEI